MKKLLLILMMLVLPLQMTWAAASAYCQHEQGKAAQHLGHHNHEHQTKSETPESKGKPGQAHPDCHFCHGIGQASLGDDSALAMPSAGSAAVEQATLLYISHIPDGPKRPDWTIAVA